MKGYVKEGTRRSAELGQPRVSAERPKAGAKCSGPKYGRIHFCALIFLGASVVLPNVAVSAGPHVIQVIADKDNRFKVPGQKNPVITVKAGEVIRLRITARKGTEWDKDGSVHSFTIKELKDQGWDLRLKEGTQEFTLVAPSEPSEYLIECTVKCGEGHDDMRMKLIVAP